MMAGISKRLPIILVLLFLLTAMLTGCADNQLASLGQASADGKNADGQGSGKNDANKGAGAGGQSTNTMRITVYQASNDAKYLVPEVHVVPLTNHPLQTAVELLLAGTKNANLTSVVPQGTKLRGITVKEHTAFVDFNDRLIKGGNGGSASEMLLVGAIVDTLTEFPDVESVQILVDGKKVDTLYGHMDTGEPLGRAEKIIKK